MTKPRLRSFLPRWLLEPTVLAQGLHVDPLAAGTAPPDRSEWSPCKRDAMDSSEMDQFRSALRPPDGGEPRAGVLGDLAAHYQLTEDECLHRCLRWEDLSVAEWNAGERTTPAAIRDFYLSVTSWSFDLLWYAYLQGEGYGVPQSVAVSRFLAARGIAPHGRHLDYGSGVGVTSQLFAALGYETDLAEVSVSLLDFARFRLDRRETNAKYVDLNRDALEQGRYQVSSRHVGARSRPRRSRSITSCRASTRWVAVHELRCPAAGPRRERLAPLRR